MTKLIVVVRNFANVAQNNELINRNNVTDICICVHAQNILFTFN
jgi:hypothetical protein